MQSRLDMLTPFEGLFQSDEHHMITARLELDRLAWLDFNAGNWPHFHNAVFHAHLVNLETIGNVGRPACEPLGDRTGVGDRHVTAAYRCALRRRTYPGGQNFQAANGDIVSLRRQCGKNSKHRHDESEPGHLSAPD